jgi:hypothetical protein
VTAVVLALAAALLGYLAGRTRPGAALLDWAEDAARPGWRSPTAWAAVPVILVALAWMWTVHPRRTAANMRSWKAGPPARSPAVQVPGTPRPERLLAPEEPLARSRPADSEGELTMLCPDYCTPKLTPTTLNGDPRCGFCPDTAPTIPCGRPATWHVAWYLRPPAAFSLLCDEHMAAARVQFAYVDRHPAAVICDMPGAGWLVSTPSRCVIAPSVDLRADGPR